MKTKTITLYAIDELSEQAKQRAHNDYLQEGFFYGWSSENRNTLTAFKDLFSIKLDRDGDYQTIQDGSNFPDLESLSGPRLLTYLWNEYGKVIFKPKQYWICNGHKNAVGLNSKHRNSNIFITPWNCSLTGYHMDNYILAPLIEYMTGKKETFHPKHKIDRVPFDKSITLESLLRECIASFNKAVQSDYEDSQSFENFIETAQSNEWTFTETGKLEN
jgi:hypothetical protein